MEKTIKNGGSVWEFVKALIVAIIFTLLMVLIFAAVIRFLSVETAYIPIINQIIKCLSIVLSMLICFTRRPNGWLRGFLFGILYIFVSFLIFSAFSSQFDFDLKLLNDCVLGGFTGLIAGVITANVKKEPQKNS